MKRVVLWLALATQPAAWAQDDAAPQQPAETPWLERTWQGMRDQKLSGALRLDYFRSSRELDPDAERLLAEPSSAVGLKSLAAGAHLRQAQG